MLVICSHENGKKYAISFSLREELAVIRRPVLCCPDREGRVRNVEICSRPRIVSFNALSRFGVKAVTIRDASKRANVSVGIM
jgi:hypothetical protein